MLRASSSRAKLEKLPQLYLSEGGGARKASEVTDARRGPREGAKAGLIRGTTSMSSISEWGGCKGGTGRDGAADLRHSLGAEGSGCAVPTGRHWGRSLLDPATLVLPAVAPLGLVIVPPVSLTHRVETFAAVAIPTVRPGVHWGSALEEKPQPSPQGTVARGRRAAHSKLGLQPIVPSANF